MQIYIFLSIDKKSQLWYIIGKEKMKARDTNRNFYFHTPEYKSVSSRFQTQGFLLGVEYEKP